MNSLHFMCCFNVFIIVLTVSLLHYYLIIIHFVLLIFFCPLVSGPVSSIAVLEIQPFCSSDFFCWCNENTAWSNLCWSPVWNGGRPGDRRSPKPLSSLPLLIFLSLSVFLSAGDVPLTQHLCTLAPSMTTGRQSTHIYMSKHTHIHAYILRESEE